MVAIIAIICKSNSSTLIASFEIELDSISEEDLKEINNKILTCSKDLSFIILND